MRRRTFILVLLASAGCRSRSDSSGDFARFFVSEVHTHGGRTQTVDPLPVIEGRWRVERDESGFQVHLFGVEFAVVDSFMTRILGEPDISTPANLDGDPQRMYGSQMSRMHIELIGRKGEVYVVAVGPRK
jgi:hypothetical protein